MIGDLLDQPYWTEFEKRLTPIVMADPRLKIFNYILKNHDPASQFFVLLFDRDLESTLNYYDGVLNDPQSDGISPEIFQEQIDELLCNLKKVMLENYWNYIHPKNEDEWEEFDTTKKKYFILKKENNLEKIFLEIDDFFWNHRND